MGTMALKIVLFALISIGHCMELKSGAYEDFVITINENVPVDHCKSILNNLEVRIIKTNLKIKRVSI